jgi:hypothetical protein
MAFSGVVVFIRSNPKMCRQNDLVLRTSDARGCNHKLLEYTKRVSFYYNWKEMLIELFAVIQVFLVYDPKFYECE